MTEPPIDFDPVRYMPGVKRQEERLAYAAAANATEPPLPAAEWDRAANAPPRQPHAGYSLLLGVIGTMVLLLITLVVTAIGKATHRLSAADLQPYAAPKLSLLLEGLAYVLTVVAVVPLFQAMWRRRFSDVLEMGWATARRHAWKLFATGLLLAVVAQLIESRMTLPKEMPVDAFFRSTVDVWLVAIFGTFVAPWAEELLFRGFLLRSVAIAYDWIVLFVPAVVRFLISSVRGVDAAERDSIFAQRRLEWAATGDMSRPAWIFSALLTSVLFAGMHAAQLGHAWNAVAVLTLVGLGLAAVRIRLKSVAASALVHMGYNGFLFIVLFLATDGFRHLDKIPH